MAASCPADWDLGGLELLLALGLAVVDWVWAACGGGSEVEGVAMGLVVGAAGGPPPAATAAARDELGG